MKQDVIWQDGMYFEHPQMNMALALRSPDQAKP